MSSNVKFARLGSDFAGLEGRLRDADQHAGSFLAQRLRGLGRHQNQPYQFGGDWSLAVELVLVHPIRCTWARSPSASRTLAMDDLTIFADLSPIASIFASNTVATFDGFAARIAVNGVDSGTGWGRRGLIMRHDRRRHRQRLQRHALERRAVRYTSLRVSRLPRVGVRTILGRRAALCW